MPGSIPDGGINFFLFFGDTMNIGNKQKKKTLFRELEVGDVFKSFDSMLSGEVLMKLDECSKANGLRGNAVQLTGKPGKIWAFCDSTSKYGGIEKVEPINLEVKVDC